MIPDKTEATIIPIIERTVRSGSIIHAEETKVYRSLQHSLQNYGHSSVQHSVPKQEMVVPCLLDRDLKEKYKGVNPKIKEYLERLKKYFTKDTTLLQNLKTELDFKKQMRDPKSTLRLLRI